MPDIKDILRNEDFGSIVGDLCVDTRENRNPREYMEEYDGERTRRKESVGYREPKKIAVYSETEKEVDADTGEEKPRRLEDKTIEVAQIVTNLPKKIVRTSVAFLFGGEMTITAEDPNNGFSEFKKVYKRKLKMQSVLKEFARKVLSETKAAIVLFEVNPDSKILELIEKGEEALNVGIKYREQIVKRANGSFHIAQLICKELCIIERVIMTLDKKKELNTDINYVVDKIMTDLSRVFEAKAREFAIGSRLRSSGRAPYFHLLYWLSESKDWTIRMADIYLKHPTHKASISQVADKGFLYKLINNSENIRSVIHYDEYSKVLTVEDPKFMFYLQNLNWTDFVKRIGFSKIHFDKKYDFALSFAGEVRSIVAELAMLLSEEYECSVFYDFNEQHKIIGEDLTDYFEPIYTSDAEFIVVFLDKNYPRKLWTNFESDKFKKRFGEHAVIPIILKGCEPTQFDKLSTIGNLPFDPEKDQGEQIKEIADIIVKKLDEKRRNEPLYNFNNRKQS